MIILVSILLALAFTFLFDFIIYKFEQKRRLEESWKAVNDQREREGKKRWDGKDEKN